MSLLILDLEQNLIHRYRNIIKFIQTQNRTETEIKAPFGQDINLSSTILCLKFKNFDLKNFFYRVQSSQPPYTKMLLILQFWEGCHLMCASRPLFSQTGLQKMCQPCIYVWMKVWGLPKWLGGRHCAIFGGFFHQKQDTRQWEFFLYRPPKNRINFSITRLIWQFCSSQLLGSSHPAIEV